MVQSFWKAIHLTQYPLPSIQRTIYWKYLASKRHVLPLHLWQANGIKMCHRILWANEVAHFDFANFFGLWQGLIWQLIFCQIRWHLIYPSRTWGNNHPRLYLYVRSSRRHDRKLKDIFYLSWIYHCLQEYRCHLLFQALLLYVLLVHGSQ